MIKIKNVSKVYGKPNTEQCVVALNDINLEIKDGEFIGIIGESGSGKSTLLNLIGTLDLPTCGNIEIDDVDITSFNEKLSAEFRRNNLGFIFQNYFLESDFSVLTNVEIPLMLTGVDKKKRKEIAMATLHKVGMAERAESRVNELSGGQMQCISIARALVNKPKLILADEPTGNLDSKNGLIIIKLLKELAKEGVTVILVTHNMLEAQNCDRLIRLNDGEIVEIICN